MGISSSIFSCAAKVFFAVDTKKVFSAMDSRQVCTISMRMSSFARFWSMALRITLEDRVASSSLCHPPLNDSPSGRLSSSHSSFRSLLGVPCRDSESCAMMAWTSGGTAGGPLEPGIASGVLGGVACGGSSAAAASSISTAARSGGTGSSRPAF